MSSDMRDVGATVVTKGSIGIQNVDAGTDVTGAAVNVVGKESLVAVCQIGAATGTPSAQTHRFKLQDSPDGSVWTDIAGKTLDLTADDAVGEIDLDCQTCDRDVRVFYDEANSSFTAGSSPTNDIAAVLVLGGADEVPAV